MAIQVHMALHPDRPVRETAELAMAAERLGFGGLWIADSQSLFRDVFTALALAAAHTKSIPLGTGVTNPLTRHPAVLAGAIASVDEISEGRAFLGIGTGETAVQTIGRPPARLSQIEDTVGVVRDLLDQGHASFEGHPLEFSWRRQSVPVYVASTGPRSLAVAGRVADGVYLKTGADPEILRYAVEGFHSSAREAGRDLSKLRVNLLLPCAVSDDGRSARDTVRGFAAAIGRAVFNAIPHGALPEYLLDELYALSEHANAARERQGYVEWLESPEYHSLITDSIIDAFSIAGTPNEVIERFLRLGELGVDGINVPFISSDPWPQIEAIGRTVIPALPHDSR